MIEYIDAIRRGLRDVYGFPPLPGSTAEVPLLFVPDGVYPLTIDGKVDNVLIEGGRIYVGTHEGKVVCINTGEPRFTGWPTWGANMAHTNIAE